MGYAILSDNALRNVPLFNRGYPRCSSAGPKDCVDHALYGDTQRCAICSFSSPGGDSWNMRFSHDCDTNGAQRGSALYGYIRDSKGIWVPVVFAVHNTAVCSGENCKDPLVKFPNGATRFVPLFITLMSFVREAFP